MKRIIAILSLMITFVLVVGVSSSIIAQSLVPQGFNYQAVARDAAGEPIANQLISMKISVVSGSANGQVNYTEVHGVTTNEFGLITLTVGSGKPLQGDFKDIPWSEANQWLKIAMDTKGGEDFLEMGASQILTSPYAFYAETAGTIENPDDPGGDSRAVDWNLAGNTGSTPGTHYIGTTDSKAVLFKTDGTERMRISATGDIGVNVIPQAQFHIKGSGAVMEFAIEATAGNPDFTLVYNGNNKAQFKYLTNSFGLGILVDNGAVGYSGISTSKTSIFISGLNQKVGINTISPLNRLHIAETTNGTATQIRLSAKTGGGINRNGKITFNPNKNFIYFENGGFVGVGVDGGGNVGVKTNNPSYDFHVNGKMKSDGYTETSDRRLKKEIHTLENALDKVMALRGVSYYWRVDEFKDRNLDSRLQMGVIAQEIEEILPNVVDTDKEGYKSVQYTQLVPLLIEAMQEQQAIIDQQNILLQSNAGSISSMKQDIENLRVALEREGIEVEDSDSAEK